MQGLFSIRKGETNVSTFLSFVAIAFLLVYLIGGIWWVLLILAILGASISALFWWDDFKRKYEWRGPR
jgi:hypothetical protein